MADIFDSGDSLKKGIVENSVSLKELAAINQTTGIINENKSIQETLQQICHILPAAWQYPESTVARIRFDTMSFTSPNFIQTNWFQLQPFETIDFRKGIIEIYYTKEFPLAVEGPFLKVERHLINNIASLITGYINNIKGKEILKQKELEAVPTEEESNVLSGKLSSRQLLQKFLNKNNADRDLYHDLMPFKVKEILLVSNLYDAYIIENEGRFSEYVLGEYYSLSLTSMPRITGVTTEEEALYQLRNKHYDMIIMMIGVDKNTPVQMSEKLKRQYPYIPIFILLNNNNDIEVFRKKNITTIDRIFVWNGDSRMFFGMIKLLEDRINVENDTQKALVRVILLVEDSPKYYSRYLPALYSIVLEQTKRIIDDVTTDELYKVLKLRARPKILLATNYEEAVQIVNEYRDFMLCLITDMKFEKNNVICENAGEELIHFTRAISKDLPIILQSSEEAFESKAHKLKATFINKNSQSLNEDFKDFIMHYLGFGKFIFKDNEGKTIAVAHTLKEFEHHLRIIHDESLIYHARHNHFSLWLMARGEIQAAKIINPAKVSDFDNSAQLREYLLNAIQKFRNEQNIGKVIPFHEEAINDESNIVSIAQGSFGGKGRGLAFINSLIQNYDFSKAIPNIRIRTPKTSVVGTDEFEYFFESNNLRQEIADIEGDYLQIKQLFLRSDFSETTIIRLSSIIKLISKPLAVRSSGLFEDSLMQPFAGIFDTYLLPNNHPDFDVRLQQLMDAVKLVYASMYSKTAKSYIEAINYNLDEERMAVIIQEVVGNHYSNSDSSQNDSPDSQLSAPDCFYPHFSGVAQSYNYYPFAHMKPEEGFAVIATGLGRYVVEGEKAFRFSPLYPNLEINSTQDSFKNSQLHFYAVNLKNKELNLLEGEDAGLISLEIDVAERHGTLNHCASVYDKHNDRIVPGLDMGGPRIINFADILKYNYIPLAETLELIMDIGKEAMGCPVELEFAVDMNKDELGRTSLYLLQIKPLLGAIDDYNINLNEVNKNNLILFTDRGMGNGIINNISDVIYIDREKFDSSKTIEMMEEIERLNIEMVKLDRKYILIGPGRWGTRDRWIGIPVAWPQISNAKVIVETDFEDFPIEASSGSHFFHNVTSMNVGYLTVHQGIDDNFIAWEKLDQQKLVGRTNFFKHIQFPNPLSVKMDGKQRISLICE